VSCVASAVFGYSLGLERVSVIVGYGCLLKSLSPTGMLWRLVSSVAIFCYFPSKILAKSCVPPELTSPRPNYIYLSWSRPDARLWFVGSCSFVISADESLRAISLLMDDCRLLCQSLCTSVKVMGIKKYSWLQLILTSALWQIESYLTELDPTSPTHFK